jgi:hypothetical protein
MNGTGKRPRLTYANVVSTLALLLLLTGGTAYGATQVIRRNSVGSENVKDGSLTSADLRDGAAVTGADVVDGSLGGADLGPGTVGGAQIADGSIGAAKIAAGSVTGAQLGKGAVAAEDLLPGSVSGANVLDDSVQGADVGKDTVTGANIDEATIPRVESTAMLHGRPPTGYVRANLYEVIGPLATGTQVSPGVRQNSASCKPGDVLLGGGPRVIGPGHHILASFAGGNSWVAQITSNGEESWRVDVVCADQ